MDKRQTFSFILCHQLTKMRATRNNATSLPTLRVIGLMSGTSLDGCDAVLTEISPRGSSVHINTLAFITHPMPSSLREKIVSQLKPEHSRMDELSRLDALLAHWFVEAIDSLLATTQYTREDIDLIGSHGQTMWHDVNLPKERSKERMTWQLGDGSYIAAITGITTVSDFRTADVAIGGQGAPLIPFFDHLLYASSLSSSLTTRESEECTEGNPYLQEVVALQNIGGIGNVTLLPPISPSLSLPVLGFDTGPGNMIIDRFVELATNHERFYDLNGEMAAQGILSDELLDYWLQHPFFVGYPPKSTGREQFGHDIFADQAWHEATVTRGLSVYDAIATATALTAKSIALSFRQGLQVMLHKGGLIPTLPDSSAGVTFSLVQKLKVIVAGGGAHNKTLLSMIERYLRDEGIVASTKGDEADITVVCASDEKGDSHISSDAKEAIAFAVLAYQVVTGRRNHLPVTTGASREVPLGKICPGANFYQALLSAQERHYHRPVSASTPIGSVPVTETRLLASEGIDSLSAVEIVDIMNCEDTHVTRVVASLREAIAEVASLIADSITGCMSDSDGGGRVFYFGAGTSGRLGVLDASEIPPTFSAPKEWFQGIIAGGDTALRTAVEGAEDSVVQGERDVLERLALNGGNSDELCTDYSKDIVVGIASSGTTPYVHGVLRAATEKGKVRRTILITCNPLPVGYMTDEKTGPIGPWTYIDTVIAAVVGPEVVTGSTRMKAGTATKLILNQMSTVAMILAGKTFGNLMVDLKMSNEKLKRRAVRILRTVLPLIGSDDEAKELLTIAKGSVKLAIAVYLTTNDKRHDNSIKVVYNDEDRLDAEKILYECKGRLGEVVKRYMQ